VVVFELEESQRIKPIELNGHQGQFLLTIRLPTRFTIATAATAATTIAAPTTAAAIAATASTTTASTTKSASTAAISAIFAWSSFVHSKITTVEFLAIELSNGSLTFFFRGHFNKTKPPGTSSFAVFNYRRRFYCTGLGKQLV
jgi:hypothetical protein